MRAGISLGVILVLAGGLSSVAEAADFSLEIAKGQPIIVKIPHALWAREKLNAASGQPIYVVEVDNNFLSARKWEQGDIPYLQEFHLEKTEECGRMRYDCKLKGFRQVELRTPAVWLKLRFAPDVANVDGAFRDLVSLGSESDFENSDYFKTKIFAAQVPKVFAGPLTDLPEPTKLQLFLLGLHNGAEQLSSETYKGKVYLVVKMGEGSDIYNSIRLNQSARAGKLVNEKLLDLLKKFGSTLPDNGNLYGIKLEQQVPFKDFTRESDPISYDQLHIYAPSEFIRKFGDADITNQQFIDGCSVLLNSNRIQVNLSAS
jgi:hypothetical protein